MITEIVLFSSCLGLGLISRLWYALLMFVEKKMKNRAASVTLEFISAAILVCSLVFLVFFINDGKFVLYSVLGVVIGFTLASIFV